MEFSRLNRRKGGVYWDVWFGGWCQLMVWTTTGQTAVLSRRIMDPGWASWNPSLQTLVFCLFSFLSIQHLRVEKENKLLPHTSGQVCHLFPSECLSNSSYMKPIAPRYSWPFSVTGQDVAWLSLVLPSVVFASLPPCILFCNCWRLTLYCEIYIFYYTL